MPWIDTRLRLGPILSWVFKQPNSPQMEFQFKRMGERQALAENHQEGPGVNERDLLSRFMEAQASDSTLPPW